MSLNGPHDFVDDEHGYGCKVCGAKYHCAGCNDGSGMYGHYTSDADGSYFSCVDPERKERDLKARGLR
jgi:hypothetical protein